MAKSPNGSSATQSVRADAPARRLTLVGNTLTFSGEGFELVARTEQRETDRIWLEPCNQPGQDRSFVVVFGWCYRISSDAPVLSDNDCGAILEAHRRHETINLDAFSGNYCILSYDHLADTLWCCSDLWALQGYYFGSDANTVTVGSRAALVANRLGARLDGYSYIAMLRGTYVVPGRTLFSGVHRSTCGVGLKLDFSKRSASLQRVGDIWQPVLDVSFAQALERSVAVVTSVCLRATSLPDTSVDLTGGNDTRLTAAVLSMPRGAEIGRRTTFKVHATEDHPDAVVARRVANEFNWTLRRFDPPRGLSDDAVDSLREAAVLSDGHRLPYDIAKGLSNERAHWAGYPHLVGSLGGEFFRDYYWRHELLNMARSPKVDYDALLAHKLYASPDVDFERVSRGRVSREDHDDYLKSAHRWIEADAPDLLNVYKLDRIFLQRYPFYYDHWRFSSLRTLKFPYLTAEALDVSLRIPWRFRRARRLQTRVLEKLQPRLTRIPSDAGAPMYPLRVNSIGAHAKFFVTDTYKAFSRHFLTRTRPGASNTERRLPESWLEHLRKSTKVVSDLGAELVVARALDAHSEMRGGEFRELQMILLVSLLKEIYPNLQIGLDFDQPEPLVLRTACQPL